MPLSTQPYKGARDFYPEDKRLQKYMFSTMRKVVERYGYEEYDAPILEPTELFTSKTSQEIVNEQTYTFTDRGDRSVTIRTEMTPSVSRMVAGQRQELAYPVRWYSIPNLWRYERPQRGRLREFWQLNVDIFGVDGLEGDHEMILVADEVMRAFGAKRDMYQIRINSRRLMDAFLQDVLGLDDAQAPMLIHLIDRLHKMDKASFVAQADAIFTPTQREQGASDQLFDFLSCQALDELPEPMQGIPPVKDLVDFMKLLRDSYLTNVRFDPTLMRGFDYYTGIVFEIFDTHPENNRSMFGGGRYEGLVGLFGVEPVSAVGFGMGDVPLQNFLETHKLLPALKPETDVRVILIGNVYQAAQRTLAELRELGVKVSVDLTNRKLDKQLKAAAKSGVPYVLFIGEKELEAERFTLKHLLSGEEETHSLERLVSIIKDYRKK